MFLRGRVGMITDLSPGMPYEFVGEVSLPYEGVVGIFADVFPDNDKIVYYAITNPNSFYLTPRRLYKRVTGTKHLMEHIPIRTRG